MFAYRPATRLLGASLFDLMPASTIGSLEFDNLVVGAEELRTGWNCPAPSLPKNSRERVKPVLEVGIVVDVLAEGSSKL